MWGSPDASSSVERAQVQKAGGLAGNPQVRMPGAKVGRAPGEAMSAHAPGGALSRPAEPPLSPLSVVLFVCGIKSFFHLLP